ncbi:hypothetical protein AD953_01685, partial [Acetobacter malorum]
MEDQPIEVVGQVAKGQFRLSAGEADGADEQVEPVFLMREDMLNMRTDRRGFLLWLHDGESRVKKVLEKAGVTLVGFDRFQL